MPTPPASPSPSDRLRDLAAVALLALGGLQIVGALTGSPGLMRLGRASVAAPLPLVFSRVGDTETFSQRFALEVALGTGERRRFHDREVAQRLDGPFSLRSAYLGALSFWSLFPEPDRTQALDFALCGDGPLVRPLGLASAPTALSVETWSARDPAGTRRRLDVTCRP